MNNILTLLFLPILNNLDSIEKKVDKLMAFVSIQQEDLDDIAGTVGDVADDLQAILDSDTDTPPADETAIRAAVEKLKAVGPKTEVNPDDQTLPGEPT